MNIRFFILILILPLNLFGQSDTIYSIKDSLKAIGTYKNDLMEGYWTWYYWNGSMQSQGDYYQNTPIGKWTNYYKSGKIKNIVNYDSTGKIQGLKINYNYESNEIIEVNYIDNKKNGLAKWTSFEGHTTLIANHKNDLFDGDFIRYWPNGKIKQKNFLINGLNQGVAEYFFESGKLSNKGYFWNDYHIGKWESFLENGSPLKTVEYDSIGQFHGDYWSYNYEDSIKTLLTYKFNKMDGPSFQLTLNNDTLTTGYFSNNLRDGQWKWFWKDGSLKSLYFYSEGKLEGICIEYYDNGKIKEKGNYYNDQKTGIWFEYESVVSLNYCKGSFSNNQKNGIWDCYKDNNLFSRTRFDNGQEIKK